MTMMIPITLIFSFLFTRLVHPLSMGLVLLIQTIVISLMAGLSAPSFWFSYILFLIFLGGMLVLFIYVSSLASNESFSFSLMAFLGASLALLALLVVFTFLDFATFPMVAAAPSSVSEFYSTSMIISWIYNKNLMIFTLFIILYLLLTLVVVVKMTSLFKGPLRLSS
nr:NADH dehydrogenase subunit 6 [Carcinus maenas]